MTIRSRACTLMSTIAMAHVACGQGLPAPTRTAYKCELAGKVTYSDAPCLNAKKVELEPTRGLSATSGREMVGPDVRHERHRELMAEAIHPLTGMDSKQVEALGRRRKLKPDAQQACQQLDVDIPVAEAAEKRASQKSLPQAQSTLLTLRRKFVALQC